MTKNRPTISQIIFSLIFLLSLWYFKNGFFEWATVYLLFYWIWLTYLTGKLVRHPMTNKYGKSLADTNTIFSLLAVFGVFFILLLSSSLLARIIFTVSGFYYSLLLTFILSVVGHIYIAAKNILTIDNNQDKIKLILGLLIYPFGIWTVQETLKTNETKK